MKGVLFFLMVLFCSYGVAQQGRKKSVATKKTFTLKGSVKDYKSKEPIKGIQVYVIGSGGFPIETDDLGRFKMEVKIGDELVITGLDIVPVYYTIKTEEDVDVLVEDFYKPKGKDEIAGLHKQYLDTAKYYQHLSIEKSLSALEKSLQVLDVKANKKERAASLELLGDVYMHWKQFDLAVTNYKSAINEQNSGGLQIKLGKAYLKSKEYAKGKDVLEALVANVKLSDEEKIDVYSGIADAYAALADTDNSLKYRTKALDLAKKTNSDKQTDINAKLAETYAKQGAKDKALGAINSSLELAMKDSYNVSNLLKAQDNAANFYNSNNWYEKEIATRKNTLETAKNLDGERRVSSDSVSLQKINYKIAAAYIASNNYQEAIPYLKESIAQANKREDIVVEKDATRKLSEVYRTVGDYKKALESYQNYVQLVDTLYLKKEQQISQATRFRNIIAANQQRITSLEKEWQLQRSKTELANKNQQLTSESNRRQEWTIYTLILGVVLLALTSYFFFKTNKEQRINNNLLALKSLRSQMNPHFIFNALNSVNHYIATNDERNANRFLSQFSTLMRSVLENSEEDVIPFSKELELLQLYTKLEHSRFTDKFDYDFVVDEDIAKDEYLIPPMLLQPYVENAIWHGLRYKEDKGNLLVKVSKLTDDKIQITIEDNGIGRKQSAALKTEHQKKQKSKAMGNITRRIAILNSMYKDKVGVVVEDIEEPSTGTRVIVTLKKD